MAHVSEKKKVVVKEIVDNLKKYPLVAAIDMENLPTPQLQKMRAQLRGTTVLTVAKRRLIKIALKEAEKDKKGIVALEPYLKGMPALLFAKDNPFALFNTLKKSKSKAPAKAGQEAPNDIMISAGPTPFAPGPIISELAMLGLKTGVENGKVAVKEDKVVIKAGETINAKAAELLTRLGIEPMEVGLNLTACFENGEILTKDVLDIDEEAYFNNFAAAGSESFNLAMFIGYPCKETIEPMLAKAHNDARAVALSENIITDETVNEIISKAEAQAVSVKTEAKL